MYKDFQTFKKKKIDYTMIRTSKNELTTLLKFLGLKKKSNVLFHTSLIPFGKIEGGVSSIYNCAKKIVGEEGNIIVPTFSYSYRRKKIFDVRKTPSYPLIGVFSEFIRKKAHSYRNLDPLFSFACIGPKKKELLYRENINCFGKNSVYEKLFNKDILVISLGISYSTGLTAFLHLEKEANVFYRVDKIFKGNTIDHKGKKIIDNAVHFIRREKIFKHFQTNREKVWEILEKKKISKFIVKNNHKHFSLNLQNFGNEVLKLLSKKPDIMLEKK